VEANKDWIHYIQTGRKVKQTGVMWAEMVWEDNKKLGHMNPKTPGTDAIKHKAKLTQSQKPWQKGKKNPTGKEGNAVLTGLDEGHIGLRWSRQ